MKLRRALAAAAVTAAIAPMALLAAPAASATDNPSASPTASESATETATVSPSASESQSATATASVDPSQSGSQSPTTDPTASESATETAPGTPTTPGSPSATASVSPSPSASAPEEDFCETAEDEVGLSEELTSGLSGLPETIVAGSGWTEFSFDVTNSGDEDIKNIKPLIGVAALGWDDGKDYSGQITVQVFDKAKGGWTTLADAAGEGATFTPFSLGAGQSTSYQLRLSVNGKVPDAIGLTGGFAQYSDAEGCWMADDPNGWIYFFDILAAGSDAGKPGDAKPQGGMADLDDINDVDATGSLANTGSSSALPMIGLVGGVAVVAGAGAVFVVRRKKAGAEA
ncbi:LAETG motif-containing sortase-dependent surface protein [Streptomyces sp. TRM70350]|uniref:LAETG motif-containing sortase-dependent surface protein n=1 Tax=Streptomyces sp. TRM70350 TaxID=2856165 RepID=UPI001C479E26|nr:LAETG motif-containing sortase-dependent surface protein [Streptomyces sp. TRM70350]MBV7697130.1 LPXTG cell wall anchor domain-containing protein [Streptomyces sp. TRM70350]